MVCPGLRSKIASCEGDRSVRVNALANIEPNPVAPPTASSTPTSITTASKTAPPPLLSIVALSPAIGPKDAEASAGAARLRSGLGSCNAAKATGTRGDVKWVQKGGYTSAR